MPDSLAERSEFELPVPVSKLSYDSTMLGLRSVITVITPHRVSDALVLSLEAAEPNGAASLWNPAAELVAVAHAHEEKI